MKTKTLISITLIVLTGFLIASAAIAASEMAPAAREIPPEIADNLKRWVWIANSLRILQVVLGILGTASALLVTTFTEQLRVRWIKICSFTAALAIGILSAFDVGSKADSTRRAWRHLTTAILKYHSDTTFTITQLIDAYTEAEAMVGDVPFHKQETPSTSATPAEHK
jgi:hypothetical protein